MKFKGTIWLIAVFIGIVLYYYLVDVPAEKKRKEEKERSEKVLLFDTDRVEGFHLSKKDQTIHLRRKDADNWELLKPVKDKADSRQTNTLLSTIQNARFSRVVDDAPKDLSVYGLKEPSLKITLQLKDKKEKTLLIGDDNPINNTLYVKRGEENKVLLSSANRKALDKSVFDLRNKTILDFKNEEITKIILQNEGTSFELIKNGDIWEMVDRVKSRAGADEIRRFLNLVKSGKVQEFIDENPKTLSTYGLDSPRIQVTLEAGKENKPLTLLVGSKKENKGYYGKTGEAKNIVLLGLGLVDILSQKPVDFMSKVLLEFKEEQVAQLNISSKEEGFEILRDTKDSSQWHIKQPVTQPADSATVNSILFDLKDARVKEFVKSTIKDPAIYGLDKPQKMLKVQMKNGEIWTLDLGNTTSDGEHYFGRRAGETTVFTIPADTVNKLFRSLHDVKDKHLLSFQSDEIEKILLEYSDQTFELHKQDEHWSLEKPEKIREIKRVLGNDILWTLNNLEYETTVEPTLPSKETGLDVPVLTITLLNHKNQTAGKLSIGKKVKDKKERYARKEGNSTLYTIKSRFLEEVPKEIEHFKS